MPNPNKVLIVDDEPVTREILKRALRSDGFKVAEAADGDEALEILEFELYGVIILDLMMPGTHGLDVLRVIRERWPLIKVIILTASMSLDSAVRALRHGAYDFVTKPFAVGEVRATTRRAADKLRLETHLSAIYDLSHDIGLSRSVDEVVEKVLDAAGSVLDFKKCHLFLMDETENALFLYDAVYTPSHFGIRLSLTDDASVAVVAARQNVTVYVADLMVEDAFTSSGFGGRSELAAPMNVRGKVIGVLDAVSEQVDAFSTDDVQMLSTLAAQAAVAIENAHLYEQISRSLAERRLINNVVFAAASTLDFDEALARALRIIHQTFELTYLNFVIPDESGRYLYVHPSLIGPSPAPEDGRIPIEGSLEGQVYTKAEATWFCYARHASRSGCHLSVPVCSRDRVVAVLNAGDSRCYVLNKEMLHALQAIANQLGVVLENSRLYESEHELRKLVEQSHAQLVQSEKLVATGRMAASIAHEINNPLQSIHNGLQYMLEFPMSPDQQKQYLQMANEEVERLMEMTARILNFARPARQEMQPTDLNALVANVLTLAGKFLQHNDIRVNESLAPDLPPVMATPGELSQVFLNLVVNAIEAMPQGGELSVASRWDKTGEVEISIGDTGHGIETENLSHIFEPFYSTKEQSTGLGLSISYNVVQRHRGAIDVQSEVGQGSTFTVRFPIGETPDRG